MLENPAQESVVKLTLNSIIWLATKGELQMNDYDEGETRENFMTRVRIMGSQWAMNGDRHLVQEWCMNAKARRSNQTELYGPLMTLQEELYSKS